MGPCYFDAPIFFSKPRLNGVDRKIRSLLQEDIANIDAMPEYQKFSIDPVEYNNPIFNTFRVHHDG